MKKLLKYTKLAVLLSIALTICSSCAHTREEQYLSVLGVNHDKLCKYLEENVYIKWSTGRRNPEFAPVCDYMVIGVDEEYVYLYAGGGDFKIDGGIVFWDNMCQTPVRLHVIWHKNDITLMDYATPPDGSEYSAVLKALFPTEMRKKMSFSNDEYRSLNINVMKRACSYFGVEFSPENVRSSSGHEK